MKTIVRGGMVISSTGMLARDISCIDGQIASVEEPGTSPVAADVVIDATGLVVLPGVIDPHVHSRDPGMTHKETFRHSTRAAASGGVTTILEMPNAVPAVTDAEVFRTRTAEHSAVAHVDFGLWGLALGSESLGRMAELRAAGAVAVKVFWGFYFDAAAGRLLYQLPTDPDARIVPPATAGELWELLREAAALDMLVGIHCEDRSILDAGARLPSGGGDYSALLASRPAVAEAAAVATAIELAAATGARVHLLHLSTARSVHLLRQARAAGIDVTGETCPHYLALTADDFEAVGPTMKVYPPIRSQSDQDALWAGLADGTIDSVGSDHAPHAVEERTGTFSEQPAGTVGVETMVQILLDGVSRGRLPKTRLPWVLSEGTARRYGLYPSKGVIAVGADADFTIVDVERPWRIANEHLHSKAALSPFHGREGRGLAVMTVLRGNVIARDGEPVGAPLGRIVLADASSHPIAGATYVRDESVHR